MKSICNNGNMKLQYKLDQKRVSRVGSTSTAICRVTAKHYALVGGDTRSNRVRLLVQGRSLSALFLCVG